MNRARRFEDLSDDKQAALLALLTKELSGEDAELLLQNPVALKTMMGTLRRHPARLSHGRYTTLERKLWEVEQWPGIDNFEQKVGEAMEEARERLERFKEESPTNPNLNVVVVPYFGSDAETFAYALQRLSMPVMNHLRKLTADDFEWPPGHEVLTNCIRIEVLDLSVEESRRGDGFFWLGELDRTGCATAAGIYMLAQEPALVRLVERGEAPRLYFAGYCHAVEGEARKLYTPCFERKLDANLHSKKSYLDYLYRYAESAFTLSRTTVCRRWP